MPFTPDPIQTSVTPKVPAPQQGKSLGGFLGNIAKNTGDVASGLLNFPKAAIESGAATYLLPAGGQQIRSAMGKEQSAANFLGNIAKGTVKSYADTFGVSAKRKEGSLIPELSVSPSAALEHAYEKPVDTALNLLPIVSKLRGTKAAASDLAVAEEAAGASKAGNVLTKTGKNIKQGIRQIKMPGKGYVGAAQDEAAVNSVLDDLGFKGTPQQQYEALQPAMAELEGQIRPQLRANIKKFTPDEVKKGILDAMDDDGMLIGKEAKEAAKIAIDDIMDDVINKGKKQTLDSVELFNAKQKLGKVFQKLKDKSDKGGTLTPVEEAKYATRDALDKVIGQYHPEVKALTLAQSRLFDAAPSLSSARFNPPTLRAAGFSIPAGVTTRGQQLVGNALEASGNTASGVKNLAKSGASLTSNAGPLLTGAEDFNNESENPNGGLDKENSQYSPNDQLETGNNHVTTPSSIDLVNGNKDGQSISNKPKTINPYDASPEELGQLYSLALASGDKNAAEKLKEMYDLELAYQKSLGNTQKPPSDTAATKRELGKSGLRALDELEKIVQKDPNAVWKAAIPGQLGARSYDSAARRAVEGLLRARSGAAVPDSEVSRYMNANLPRVGDSPEDVSFKLAAFRRDLEAQANFNSSSNTSELLQQLIQQQ